MIGGFLMKKKQITALFLACTMAFTAIGCGSQGSPDDGTSGQTTLTDEKKPAPETEESAPSKDSATATDTDASHDPVTLRFMWWGGDERAEATLSVIDEFESLYPWITIEAEYGSDDGYQEKLTTQLVSGSAADIIQMGTGWMPGYVASNPDYFVDFKEHADTIDLSGFETSFLENNGGFDGHQYGLPTGISGHAFLYNANLAETIGLDFDQQYTWDDLLAMGEKVKAYDDSMNLLTMGALELNTMILRPYLTQLTGNKVLVDETKTLGFEEADLVNVLTYIKNLYDNGTIAPISNVISYGTDLITDPNWINQKYVSLFSYSSTVGAAEAACPEGTFSIGRLPVLNGAKNDGWYGNCPQYMCVYGHSEHIEEALMFLDYFYNDEKAAELLKTVRSVPPTSTGQKVCEELGLLQGVAKDSVDVLQTYGGINDLGLTTEEEVTAILEDAAVQVAYGQDTPENIAKNTIALLEAYISEK